jgi:hypothetical protein
MAKAGLCTSNGKGIAQLLRRARGCSDIPQEKIHGFAFSTPHVAPRILFVLHGGDYRCGKWGMAHAATGLRESTQHRGSHP